MDLAPNVAVAIRELGLRDLLSEQESALRVVEACPEEKLSYKPHEKCMTFAEEALHIFSSGHFFLNWVGSAGQYNESTEKPEVPATKAELLKSCRSFARKTIEGWKKFTPEQLTTKINFFGMGDYNGVEYLRWDMVHLVHHRAHMQLSLRLMGEKSPSIYGPTADVTFEQVMAQAAAEGGKQG